METIRNYLESMFANLPNTEKVRKAKDELWQMMEDKYTELVENGASENEAVGTVITEFGNLDELADDLGLREAVSLEKESAPTEGRKTLSLEEAKQYIKARERRGFYIAIGVFLCITCVCGPILAEAFYIPDSLGVLAMFSMIGVAIVIFVLAGSKFSKWNNLKKQNYQIDLKTANYVADAEANYSLTHALRHAIGIVLCALCWLPTAVLGELVPLETVETLSGAVLFILVGVGVFLLVYSNSINESFKTLLSLNDKSTVSGSYAEEKPAVYVSETARLIMELYWPVVTSLYLILSFLTCRWNITWIIWVVAGIMYNFVKMKAVKNTEI